VRGLLGAAGGVEVAGEGDEIELVLDATRSTPRAAASSPTAA
jgi:hypothetical protein